MALIDNGSYRFDLCKLKKPPKAPEGAPGGKPTQKWSVNDYPSNRSYFGNRVFYCVTLA